MREIYEKPNIQIRISFILIYIFGLIISFNNLYSFIMGTSFIRNTYSSYCFILDPDSECIYNIMSYIVWRTIPKRIPTYLHDVPLRNICVRQQYYSLCNNSRNDVRQSRYCSRWKLIVSVDFYTWYMYIFMSNIHYTDIHILLLLVQLPKYNEHLFSTLPFWLWKWWCVYIYIVGDEYHNMSSPFYRSASIIYTECLKYLIILYTHYNILINFKPC